MDWSKAKNILIISFIFTNIFIAYVLFSVNKDQEKVEIQDEFIEDVVALLAKESIKIDTEVPKEIPSLPIVSVEYEVYDTKKILERFLGSYTEEFVDGIITYRNDKKTVQFERNNKKIIYRDENLSNQDIKNAITKEEAIKKSEDFVITNGFDFKNTKLGFVTEQDGVYKLFYNNVVDDITVEQTNMTLEISSEGIISFERYWIYKAEKEVQVLKPTSAPKALLRLLARDEYHGKTIKKIEICYYFNMDDYRDDELGDSKGGVAVPTWKFVFQDGEKVFLEEN